MNRLLSAALLASVIAVPLAACGDDNSDVGYAYGAGGGGSTSSCSQYTTCGACTPVAGCGWCFGAGGGGSCATDPDSCGDASEFTWTWEPSGCPAADASVAPLVDAGTSATPEAAARETGSD